jgi:hypothetical protein
VLRRVRGTNAFFHRKRDAPFAYFPASPAARFPTSILSLIGSFARHPALLSRETKMTTPTWRNFSWYFDNSAQRRQSLLRWRSQHLPTL